MTIQLAPPARTGAPRIMTPELADEICRRIASGRMLYLVAADPDMPCVDAIYDEMSRSQEFADMVGRARSVAAHALAESVVEIADDPTLADRPQWVSNRCTQRRWLAGRFNKAYADSSTSDINVNVTWEQLIQQVAQKRLQPPTIEHDAPDESDS